MIHVGEQLDKILSISIENPDVLNIPQCTLCSMAKGQFLDLLTWVILYSGLS